MIFKRTMPFGPNHLIRHPSKPPFKAPFKIRIFGKRYPYPQRGALTIYDYKRPAGLHGVGRMELPTFQNLVILPLNKFSNICYNFFKNYLLTLNKHCTIIFPYPPQWSPPWKGYLYAEKVAKK